MGSYTSMEQIKSEGHLSTFLSFPSAPQGKYVYAMESSYSFFPPVFTEANKFNKELENHRSKNKERYAGVPKGIEGSLQL